MIVVVYVGLFKLFRHTAVLHLSLAIMSPYSTNARLQLFKYDQK